MSIQGRITATPMAIPTTATLAITTTGIRTTIPAAMPMLALSRFALTAITPIIPMLARLMGFMRPATLLTESSLEQVRGITATTAVVITAVGDMDTRATATAQDSADIIAVAMTIDTVRITEADMDAAIATGEVGMIADTAVGT